MEASQLQPLTDYEDVKGSRADSKALPSVLLQGEQGAGKTKAIESLLQPGTGIDFVVVLALEQGISDVLGHIPSDKLAWRTVAPSKISMSDLKSAYEKIQRLTDTDLQKLGHVDRNKFQEFIEVMNCCNSFIDERTGKTLGPVKNFPSNWAFVIDGLSGLTIIVEHFLIGLKPFSDLRDYQAIQSGITEFLQTLVNDTKCFLLLTAHLERETDENTGLSYLTVATKGKKLAPKLGRFFSDVILTERYTKGNNVAFRWVTQSSQVKTKTRNLSWSTELPPSFVPLLETWRKKQSI
jgi:hypothetical protein